MQRAVRLLCHQQLGRVLQWLQQRLLPVACWLWHALPGARALQGAREAPHSPPGPVGTPCLPGVGVRGLPAIASWLRGGGERARRVTA